MADKRSFAALGIFFVLALLFSAVTNVDSQILYAVLTPAWFLVTLVICLRFRQPADDTAQPFSVRASLATRAPPVF